MGGRAPGLLLMALVTAEIACVVAWALTGDARWGLGALLAGAAAIAAALRAAG